MLILPFLQFLCVWSGLSQVPEKIYNIFVISQLGMQLIFSMQGNIKVFHKSILTFLTGVACIPKIPKITNLQYPANDMLGYVDFRFAHRPPNHQSNLLHKCQSNTIANDFYSNKKEGRGRGSIPSCCDQSWNMINHVCINVNHCIIWWLTIRKPCHPHDITMKYCSIVRLNETSCRSWYHLIAWYHGPTWHHLYMYKYG